MPGSAETDIRIRVRRRILQIERKRSRIRAIVPGAAAIERHNGRRTGREIRVEDAESC